MKDNARIYFDLRLRRSLMNSAMLLGTLVVLTTSMLAQCSLLDKSRDSLYFSYEQSIKIDEISTNIEIRLHNNSSCIITILSGSAKKFYKPLPKDPTPSQILNREITYDLPDDVVVPEVQYSYATQSGYQNNLEGDSFFGLNVLGGNSIRIIVPSAQLLINSRGMIRIPFQYKWEREKRATFSYSSVDHFVRFSASEVPGATNGSSTRRGR